MRSYKVFQFYHILEKTAVSREITESPLKLANLKYVHIYLQLNLWYSDEFMFWSRHAFAVFQSQSKSNMHCVYICNKNLQSHTYSKSLLICIINF